MGTMGVIAIIFAAAAAAISSSNSSVLSAARVVFAMGRDKQVNDWMNATHKKFRTPHRAVMATSGIIALLIALSLQVEQIVALLAEVASFSFLISYVELLEKNGQSVKSLHAAGFCVSKSSSISAGVR
jgi:basic amino acid/polyamine antiporter, APA family